MSASEKQAYDAGYEVGPERLRIWFGGVEARLENQWAALLFPNRRKAIDVDLLRFGGGYDGIAARLDLHAGMLGFKLALTGNLAGSRGRQRVRQAAAEAAAMAARLSR